MQAPLLLACALLPSPTPGEDLGKVYKSALTHSESGLQTVCEREDVFRLKSFELEFGKDFEISCKEATVAVGHHGTTALWAAVFPDQPPEIETERPGAGEHASTIFLRFGPGEIGRLFPKKTVGKRDSGWMRAEALRLARSKIVWKWRTPSGNTTIVPAGVTTVDVDTVEGRRRLYALDRGAGTVVYVDEFEASPVTSEPIERSAALEAFDRVWERFDEVYAGFTLLPDVDWDRLGRSHRKLAGDVETVHELGAVISDLVAHLEDLHVWVRVGEDWIPGYTRERPLNASWAAVRATMDADEEAGPDLTWGRTDDGIGYVAVMSLGDPDMERNVDTVLEELGDTWALVVDLRFCGGGDETVGARIASRFVDEERVYSLNSYRNGSKRTSLGEPLERKLAPRGPWRYTAPVVCLQGQRTMSSAESLALMFAQCPQVTTMGDRTAGSSANPRRLELECGITVNVPTWLDMDPAGNPIEHVGVAPDETVEAASEELTDTEDPVLAAALKRLRRTPKGDREPGRND